MKTIHSVCVPLQQLAAQFFVRYTHPHALISVSFTFTVYSLPVLSVLETPVVEVKACTHVTIHLPST
jgi:hypothetical protein